MNEPTHVSPSPAGCDVAFLKKKAAWVRRETLLIHGIAPGTRLASSLSPVEIFVVLYYGKVAEFHPGDGGESGDKVIVSKGHGAISLYPILADCGYFDRKELLRVCEEGSFLGGIPDPMIPGFDTIHGSLGNGLGIACGIALGLKAKKRNEKVFVILGDGELYEGAIWEAVMFAPEHKLDNIIVVIDNNKICMLDYCRNVIDLEPLDEKFRAYRWRVERVDGHNIGQLQTSLTALRGDNSGKPKLLIADTIKGKGVPSLEKDPLCHTKSLTKEEIDSALSHLG